MGYPRVANSCAIEIRYQKFRPTAAIDEIVADQYFVRVGVTGDMVLVWRSITIAVAGVLLYPFAVFWIPVVDIISP